ncbi:hypothetical protein [Aneurinibacillus migulanus]|uniref:hypothetical protein n=1 Tax=Aneurinibacillus migulanus TaxID=47500 RepID=UPI0020A06FCE|nr:hypothetical protein [Aneurinibacillus migulanus]MCP1357424.1 hypothetical protein [Aneurinibacillus migulanus]MED4726871.1 hypothetical protein [Aneurinibacillus migulanus]
MNAKTAQMPKPITMIEKALEMKVTVNKVNEKVKMIGEILYGGKAPCSDSGEPVDSIRGVICQTFETAKDTEEILDNILKDLR